MHERGIWIGRIRPGKFFLSPTANESASTKKTDPVDDAGDDDPIGILRTRIEKIENPRVQRVLHLVLDNPEGAARLVGKLYKDNAKSRARARGEGSDAIVSGEFEEEVRTLEGSLEDANRTIAELRGKGPKKGEIVLSAEDAKVWNAIREAGIKPAEIVPTVKSHGELKTKVEVQEKKERLQLAATASKYNVDALTEALKNEPVELQVVDVDVVENGQTTKQKAAQIRKAGEQNAAWEPLKTYIERDKKALIPALTAQVDGAGSGEAATSGIRFPEMPSASQGGPGKSAVELSIERNAKSASKPNPLRPAKT